MPGNIGLHDRPVVHNRDGSISTVRTISIGTDQGEVLIPTVVNGRVVSDQEATAEYRRTGRHLGIFRTPAEATAYARQLHEQQDREYSPRGGGYRDFRSGAYAPLEATAEREFGLPAGLLSRIRTRGERSNADQVSEDNARTVYQIIPDTRDGIRRNYRFDPYASPANAARGAAAVLRERYNAHGDWNRAVTEYHGGTNPRNWGRRTRAYGRRVGRVG